MLRRILPIFIIVSILALSCSNPNNPDNNSGDSSTSDYAAYGISDLFYGTTSSTIRMIQEILL
ncbi:hypothetical protein [Brachyspira sp. G79]|uniref:hypothetical protein n=1 Tax=Brachyspira sp. G79 TaxID=1358104 RepID=UPI000BBC8559|nr:hypothetical protein [Brachyspira sp. G79]PCG20346.1 hypothetical protein KQ44_10265 [Brachyspira sp. G79]